MLRRIYLIAGITCLCLVGQGCSYQGWYTGLQEQQRQECYKSINPQLCIEKVNGTTYNQYKVQRDQALEKSKKEDGN